MEGSMSGWSGSTAIRRDKLGNFEQKVAKITKNEYSEAI